jgi:hypothetical protein
MAAGALRICSGWIVVGSTAGGTTERATGRPCEMNRTTVHHSDATTTALTSCHNKLQNATYS